MCLPLKCVVQTKSLENKNTSRSTLPYFALTNDIRVFAFEKETSLLVSKVLLTGGG